MNVQPPIVVLAESVSAVVSDAPKNAVPAGTVAGFQLAAVLKLPDVGLKSQVASCALAAPDANAVTATSAVVASNVDKTNLQPARAHVIASRRIAS